MVFDLEYGGCWDAPTETFIERADDHTISGYRYSTGWAKDQRVYFTAEFSKPFKSLAIYEGGEDGGLREGDSFRAERLTAGSVSTLRPERRSMSRSPFRP